MNPEPTVARFVHTVIFCTRKITAKVFRQNIHTRWLRECLVLYLLCHNADFPALHAGIYASVNLLTSKVEFGTLVLFHSRPHFGCDGMVMTSQYTNQRRGLLF